jgi:hypothetical protein
MTTVCAVLWLAGLYPLGLAGRANRNTSLLHAVGWTLAAWLAWGLLHGMSAAAVEPARYVALALTGAAGVAALGARRPHVLAWDVVVGGLVAVMLLPLVEALVIGTDSGGPLRVFFLSATVAVGLLNYLPTRSAPAVLLLATAMAGELVSLFAPAVLADRGIGPFFDLLVLLAPWGLWACWRGQRRDRSDFDRAWLDFRDRFGLFWAQRVREQFNHAAANAGWPVFLSWRGLHGTAPGQRMSPAEQDAMLETFRKATQRFVGDGDRKQA